MAEKELSGELVGELHFGTQGADGKDGADGYTPVKGKDYYTEADKAEIVEEVAKQVSGGNVDQAAQISMLIEADMLPAVYNENGAILTDENGNVILRY